MLSHDEILRMLLAEADKDIHRYNVSEITIEELGNYRKTLAYAKALVAALQAFDARTHQP